MGGINKKPVKAPGRASVPAILQLETCECGAACLSMVLAYYGRFVTLEELRTACGVSRDGSNAKNLLRAGQAYGLMGQGLRMEPEDLRQRGSFPCVLHWNFNYFVVLLGFQGGVYKRKAYRLPGALCVDGGVGCDYRPNRPDHPGIYPSLY